MFEALEAKFNRYTELEKLLADPKVIADRSLYQSYAKELASLTPVVSKYKEYKVIEKQIQEAEKIIEEKAKDAELVELAKQELIELKEKEDFLKRSLEELLVEADPYASKSVVVEIRAGTGGLEASLFAADLFRMYSKYAAKCRWKVDVLSTSPTEAGGFKEIIFAVEGEGVYGRLKYESGVHRVQRVPATEAGGRIHTSAATVAVLPEAEEVEVQINPKDIQIDVFRATGPGGQGVNTTDSAVRITHLPTNMVVTCQDERSQLKNKVKAFKVLRARLLDKLKREQEEKIAAKRRIQIGTGDRSEKIRTYNFPDRRVTDHRIGLTLHRLEYILEGDLDELISALVSEDRKLALKKLRGL